MSERGLVSDGRRRRALERLREAPLNFDPQTLDGEQGWNTDEYVQALVPEQPGPPEDGGSWTVARRLMHGYEFADPSIVRAFYDPEVPLERRNLLLEVRFFGLRFLVGCRVAEVYERTESCDGREVRLWGWSYQTLKGHFEQGKMHWEVRKWIDTGEVDFRIRAKSRRARDPSPIVRLGFRIFGRHEQLRFFESTCERMCRITAAALREGSDGEAVREAAERATARPASDTDEAHEQLARNVELPASGEKRKPS